MAADELQGLRKEGILSFSFSSLVKVGHSDLLPGAL